MPLVKPDLIAYEGLSCTHYNTALKLGKEGRTSPAGDLSLAKLSDETFPDACESGHWWVVLPETLAESLKHDIASWKTQTRMRTRP